MTQFDKGNESLTVNPLINISHTLVDNRIVDHSDVVGAPPVGYSNYIFIRDLTPGFNGLS